jgi:hypothetical protein
MVVRVHEADAAGGASRRLGRVGTPAGRALDALGAALRARGVSVSPGIAVAFPEIIVAGHLSVACHPAPWHGPLHFCVPDTGPCRGVGDADRPAEAAVVISRALSS